MSVLFVVLPVTILISATALLAYVWATRSGQLDDLETPAMRMLHDDASVKARARAKNPARDRVPRNP
jgi:cbb3-type cytochrome oxidase maturation protein